MISSPFYRIGREDADFAPIIEILYGYHQVKFLTPFENACWAVLTQRNPMKLAQKTKQALIEKYGNHLEVHGKVYRAFPEPIQIVVADFDEILKLIGNDRRTEYLIATARAFSEVDEEFLTSAPDEEVEAWLRNIKGIGEWSATFIMILWSWSYGVCAFDRDEAARSSYEGIWSWERTES